MCQNQGILSHAGEEVHRWDSQPHTLRKSRKPDCKGKLLSRLGNHRDKPDTFLYLPKGHGMVRIQGRDRGPHKVMMESRNRFTNLINAQKGVQDCWSGRKASSGMGVGSLRVSKSSLSR